MSAPVDQYGFGSSRSKVAPAFDATGAEANPSGKAVPVPGERVLTRPALVLGILSTIGPVAIDMYLPAFPAIAESLHTNVGRVQLSLVSFFAALMVGQLIYGPISDAIGRKRPLYAGLGLFVVASIGCSMAQSVEALIVLRFVQGLGACAGMVLSRAIVRDLHTGRDAVRLISLMMLVLSVSPMLAPLGGSLLVEFASWRIIFFVIAAGALFCAWLMWRSLPETHPPEKRTRGGLRSALAAYAVLVTDLRFLGAALVVGCTQGVILSYLAGSPFAFIEIYGVPPVLYSAIFAANAVGFIGGAQLNSLFISRIGLERLIRIATSALAAASVLLLGLTLTDMAPLPVFVGLLFLCFSTLGFIMPTTTVFALESHGARSGAASSLLGALQFGSGTIAGSLVSFFFDGTTLPMVATLAGCGAGAGLMAAASLRRRKAAV
ncbi:multidrug effflux MFS transporter [Chelatococcus sp. GCM10030263]|uniref:multidrug effflux MFS transporter n=1 Tax=Chelatococcus sp. GCM10030263 TaxID=3273387 RepID=UPI003613F932